MPQDRQRSRRGIWITSFALGLGALIGVGVFTFAYAEGASYLTDDSDACVNCHVMRSQHDAWSRSVHASVASCNDCHAPHGNLIEKYFSKAVNGFNHSWAFTTGDFPDRIRITEPNRRVVEAACRHCHRAITSSIDTAHGSESTMSCVRCHQSVGHGP